MRELLKHSVSPSGFLPAGLTYGIHRRQRILQHRLRGRLDLLRGQDFPKHRECGAFDIVDLTLLLILVVCPAELIAVQLYPMPGQMLRQRRQAMFLDLGP